MSDLPAIDSVPSLTVAVIKDLMHKYNVKVPNGKKAVLVEAFQDWLRQVAAQPPAHEQVQQADTIEELKIIPSHVEPLTVQQGARINSIVEDLAVPTLDTTLVPPTSSEVNLQPEVGVLPIESNAVEPMRVPSSIAEVIVTEVAGDARPDASIEPVLEPITSSTDEVVQAAVEPVHDSEVIVTPTPATAPTPTPSAVTRHTHIAANLPTYKAGSAAVSTSAPKSNTPNDGKSKNKKKKKKVKMHQRLAALDRESKQNGSMWGEEDKSTNDDLNDIHIEYVAEKVNDQQFSEAFERFHMQDTHEQEMNAVIDASLGDADEYLARLKKQREKAGEMAEQDSDDDVAADAEGTEKLSKKKLKKLNRLTVAELKQLVQRPDLVEVWDVTSTDPKLLIQLKSYRNTVAVPVHWSQKRKYLQNKRGIEKAPFRLPQFIADTGVGEMREALQEKEEAMGMKGKARERVRPKKGKMEIDYQKLHDAFFRYQTKPAMSIHGDLYYEAKELETHLKDKKPGDISDELREALGMGVAEREKREMPVPWLVAMQRYGPPPSYPNMRIRGLNAPIPEGCQYGFHPGGWGKPPVDGRGRPLYGDVFGAGEDAVVIEEDMVDKTERWGEIVSDSEEESESESEIESEPEEEVDETGTQTETGLETPGGYASIAGLETPDVIELRKKKIDEDMDATEAPSLYTVLPERQAAGQGGDLMSSAHTYDISSAGVAKRKTAAMETGGVELALDPTQLGDEEAIRAAYEEKMKEQEGDKEDFSDMVAEHAARAAKKRKAAKKDDKKDGKKYKEFKF